jgi:acyl-[acyl-carrier-protein]-phospholipid O-acyltransferase/long-chain-fatty-acid--[acyl-carrier-protein] ligase
MNATARGPASDERTESFWSGLHARFFYRLEVVGSDHLPSSHGALLVSNHTSVSDPILMARAVRRVLGKKAAERLSFFDWGELARLSPPAALEAARRRITSGDLVCLFPEETIERSGKLLKFTRALEQLLGGLDLPIIPVAIDQPWGSLTHRRDGRVRWKWPRRFPYTVTVCFGEPLPPNVSAFRARRAVQELQATLFERRKRSGETLPAKFVRTARRFPFRQALCDQTGRRLNFLQALAGSLVLRTLLARKLPENAYVGVLLPPSNGGALVNVALALLGKAAVNLNYTASSELFDRCLEKAELRTVVTSKHFLRRIGWIQRPEFLYVEDLVREASLLTRIKALSLAALLPAEVLRRRFVACRDPSAPVAVLFSSGSTGEPKGVVLSHFNVLSNVQAINQVFELDSADRVVGVLPFFHAFGYTVTLWFPLVIGQGALYHPDPRDGKAVAALVREGGGTLLVGPPTFFQLWLRQCGDDDFRNLRYALTGAEKLKPSVARAFRARYGLPLLEGYGATELSPVVSINTFDRIDGNDVEVGHKEGSLGHPLPGVAVKVIDVQSGEELDVGAEGMLCVKGPNVMLGYLGDPDRTAEVIQDGWYLTGDVGKIDEDGFIEITDRLSRFAKIGGEMIPLVKIESELQEIVPAARFGVTSVPDDLKGERLVVVHSPLGAQWSPSALREALRKRGLPNLWVPRPDAFLEVEEVPVLATGKTDLRALKEIAARGSRSRRDSPRG